MARRLCQFLFTLAILYGLAVGAFAYFNYAGQRPDVLTIANDMHGWVRAKFASATSKPPEPGSIPRLNADATPPASPPVGPDVTPVPTPIPSPTPPTADDPRSRAIAKVRDELLPEALVLIGKMDDPGAKVQTLKVDARVVLVKARDLLGELLDKKADDREVQKLNKRVTDLLIAVDKR